MKAILVDDEQLALDFLEHQLHKVGDVEIVGTYTDPLSGREAILHAEADVVFLDIQLPEINGILFAEQLLEEKPSLQIVFVTAYDKYAVQAFELNALDYVMKPVGTDRLRNTLNRLKADKRSKSVPAALDDGIIRMNVLRDVLIEGADRQFAPIRWRTAKAQELFLYLLHNRNQLIRKDALIELLWPESEIEKAYSQLYTSIYYVRKTMAAYGSHFMVTSLSDGYMLSLNQVRIDAEQWEEGLGMDAEIPPEQLASFEQSMQIYKGDYLQGLDYWWAESERQRLKAIWIRNAFRLAEAYRAAGQPESAITKYEEICERSPAMEEAHFALMNMFAESHQYSAVRWQYQLLVTTLKNEINEQPSTYIQEWYRNWDAQQKE